MRRCDGELVYGWSGVGHTVEGPRFIVKASSHCDPDDLDADIPHRRREESRQIVPGVVEGESR